MGETSLLSTNTYIAIHVMITRSNKKTIFFVSFTASSNTTDDKKRREINCYSFKSSIRIPKAISMQTEKRDCRWQWLAFVQFWLYCKVYTTQQNLCWVLKPTQTSNEKQIKSIKKIHTEIPQLVSIVYTWEIVKVGQFTRIQYMYFFSFSSSLSFFYIFAYVSSLFISSIFSSLIRSFIFLFIYFFDILCRSDCFAFLFLSKFIFDIKSNIAKWW